MAELPDPILQKFNKMARIADGVDPRPPLPEWPPVPEVLKQRFPDHVAELEAWREAQIEFFKKANIIRG
jgi:hypothetical protein